MKNPILFTEEQWANSQLSIVRHYGQIRYNGETYVIVDKRGRDIFECSAEAVKEGRDKAIPVGEPVDLLNTRYLKQYRELGREAFLEAIKNGEIKEV